MAAPIIVVGIAILVLRAAPVLLRAAARAAPRLQRIPKSAPKEFPKTKPGCVQPCKKGDSDCQILAAIIWEKATVLSGRIVDLLEDKLNLFKIAKDKPSPSLPKNSGSWRGHVHQAEGLQRGLQSALKSYDAKGCRKPPIPKAIRELAYTRIPSKPNRK